MEYAPWYVIVWRFIWFLPLQVFRFGFLAIAFIGWGRQTAMEAFEDTR